MFALQVILTISPLWIMTSCFVVLTEQISLSVVVCMNCTKAVMFSCLMVGKLDFMDVIVCSKTLVLSFWSLITSITF